MTVFFKPANGPECLECGCQEATLVQAGVSVDGRAYAVYECDHCGRKRRERGAEVPDNMQGNGQPCPYCGSANTHTTSSPKMRLTRYHRCRNCELTFKSYKPKR